MRKLRTTAVSLLAASLLLLASCGGSKPASPAPASPAPAPGSSAPATAPAAPAPAPAKQLTKIRTLMPTAVDEAFAPYPVAKYLGYFEEEGLDVELITTGGSTEAAIQIAAGNGEFGAPSPAQVVAGLQSTIGMQVQFFYNLYYKNIWSLTVLPDSPIKEISELKGKKIGVSSMGSSGILYAKAFLQKAGIDGEKDVTFIAIGTGAQGAAAIKSGQVDAVAYWDAQLAKLETTGLKMRDLPHDKSLDDLPDASVLARTKLLKEKPELAIGFGRAIAKAYIFTLANPEAAVRITWKVVPESRDKTMDEATALKSAIAVNKSRMAIWNSPKNGGKYGKFVDEDWKQVVDFMYDRKMLTEKVPTSKIFTNEFSDKINTFDKAAVEKQAREFDMSKVK